MKATSKDCAAILWYNCVERLNDRYDFERSCRLHHRIPTFTFETHDLFAICDAVLKRGGYLEVEERCRWREVADSLSHYNYPLELVKRVYVEHLQQYENRLRKNEHLAEKYTLKEPAVQRFLIPPRYLTGHLQHLLNNHPYRAEEALMQQLGIRFLDEYLSLRSLALTGRFLMTKLPKDLMEKYAAVCKFLIMASALSVKDVQPCLLQFLRLSDRTIPSRKVLLIGDTFFNARLAQKLTQFNIEVTLLEIPHQNKHEGQEYWPLLMQLGAHDYFLKELKEFGVDPKLLADGPVRMFDKNCEEYSSVDVKLTERMLFEQLTKVHKSEASSDLRQILDKKLDMLAVIPTQRELVMLHLTRFLMTEALLGDFTELKTLEKHVARGVPESLCVQPQAYFSREGPSYHQIKSVLLQKSASNRVRFISSSSCSVEIRENQVYLTTPQGKRIFDYLVYGIVENIMKSVQHKHFRIPQFSGEYLMNSYFVLRSVRQEQYVHREIILEGADPTAFQNRLEETCWVRSDILGCVNLRLLQIPHNRQYNSRTSFAIAYRKPAEALHQRDLEQVMHIINRVYLRETIHTIKQLTPLVKRQTCTLILKESQQERWKTVLEMRMRLYCNVPIATCKYGSRLAEFMAAGDFIYNSLLSNIYKLRDHDQSIYQSQMSEETVIIRKVVREQKEPTPEVPPPAFIGRSISAPEPLTFSHEREANRMPIEKTNSKESMDSRKSTEQPLPNMRSQLHPQMSPARLPTTPNVQQSPRRPEPVKSMKAVEPIEMLKSAAAIQYQNSLFSEKSEVVEGGPLSKQATVVLLESLKPEDPIAEAELHSIPSTPEPHLEHIIDRNVKLVDHMLLIAIKESQLAMSRSEQQINQPKNFQSEARKSPEWYFGLNHFLVSSHCGFFKKHLQDVGWISAVQSSHQLQPLSSIALDSSRTLLNLGQPYICRLKPTFSRLLANHHELECSSVPNKFVSRRIGVSVFDPSRLTYYYQTVIFIDSLDLLMYVMVDELFPSIVLYHQSLETLITSVNTQIEVNSRESVDGKLERLPTSANRNFLFTAVLRKTIIMELIHPSFTDVLLAAKLAKEGDEVTRPLYYTSKASYLCEELMEIMNETAYMLELRSLNIFELLIGQYDPRVLLIKNASRESRNSSTETAYSRYLKDLEKQKDHEQDRFRVEQLEKGPSFYKIKRRFLSLLEPDQEGFLVYSCEKRTKPANSRSKQQRIAPEKDEYTFFVGEGIYRQELQDVNRCLQFILSKLVDHFPVRHILQYFREFVTNELSKYKKLPPLLKKIYLMSMGRRKTHNPISLHLLNHETLEPQQKDELAKAVGNGRLTFLEGIPFFAY